MSIVLKLVEKFLIRVVKPKTSKLSIEPFLY